MITTAQITKIQIMRRQLDLDDDVYRAILKQEAGVESSKDLDNRGCDRVIKRLAKLGARDTTLRGRRTRQPKGLITSFQQAEIEKNYQLLGFDSFARRSGFNKRCCGKLMPQTRTDANKVIEGQKAILNRAPGCG